MGQNFRPKNPFFNTFFSFGRLAKRAPHVIWLDNFSHYLRVNCPTASSQMWRDSLWTVSAVLQPTEYDLTTIEAGLNQIPNKVYPAADDFFKKKPASFVNAMTMEGPYRADAKLTYYEDSFSKDVSRLPIRTRDVFTHGRVFIPDAILPYNIGNQVGLLQSLSRVLDQVNETNRQAVLVVDVNIYKRIIKVKFKCMSFPHVIFPLID